MSFNPPSLVKVLLARMTREDLWEAVEGDLDELYLADLRKKGRRKAQVNYLFNALAFLRFHRLRKHNQSKTKIHMSLIRNYTKVSMRDLRRNKAFSLINLTGLVAGMTVSLLMLQYVLFETSFDQFHEDYDRIYRVINDRFQNGERVQRGTITYPTIGPAMLQDFPEIEAYTRMTIDSRNYLQYQNELFLVNRYLIADEHFQTFFSFKTIAGDASRALDDVYEVILTQTFASTLIDSEEEVSQLIGQIVDLDGDPCRIGAIVEDPPKNSHLKFDLLLSYKSFIAMAGEGADNSWQWSDFYHYVKLRRGADITRLTGKVAGFGERYFKQGEVSGAVESFELQPLSEAHLGDPTLEYEIGEVSNGKIVWLLLGVAIFVMIIAWINYINLSTGRAIQRAKEVGIRKSLGAQKGQIVRQFWVETLLLNGSALAISLVLCFMLQPAFNQLTGLNLSLKELLSAKVWSLPFPLVFMFLLLGSLSLVAVYPALLVTRFQTQDILKGSFKLKGEIIWLRKGLVIFQFAVAVILISVTFAVSRQIDFMLNKDLGIDIDNTMVVYGPQLTEWDSTFISRLDQFKATLERQSGIDFVTTSSRTTGAKMGRIFQLRSGNIAQEMDLTANFIQIDHDFTEVYGLDLLAGRDLGLEDHHVDPGKIRTILVNESAIELLRFQSPAEAVNQTVTFWGRTWTIVGVVNDFHQLSLHQAIEPIFMLPYYGPNHGISIKLTSEPDEHIIEAVNATFNAYFPGNYFDYFFLEDRYYNQYRSDIRFGQISRIFTLLSILIAVLGLYGLILMTVVRKTKEIGLRKVLGASITQLIVLLGRDFILLVFMAIFLGAPIGYLALTEWQAGYSYQADLGIGLILGAAGLLILISLGTLALHTFRITSNNPVDSLRYE